MKLRQIYVDIHNFLTKITAKNIMNYKQRLAMYRMLEKMTAEPAMLQINEAVEELRNLELHQDFKTRLWYVYDDILEQMRSTDANFAKSLSPYIPQQDTMILSASEQDDITYGFTTVIENNKKTYEMKQAFSQALAYPLLMVGVLLSLLYYFSVRVIPAFTDNIPAGAILSNSSVFLVSLANNFNWWFSSLMIMVITVVIFSIWALPNLINEKRRYLEDVPPFNMYRIMVGCGFLFALNSLGRAGFMQIDALQQMELVAKPYLRYRIQVVMDLMADGMDIGQALIKSNLNFPDKQMVRELAIQIKYSEDDSLEVLSSTLAEDGLLAIKNQAQFLKFIITFIVFMTIGYLYFAIYQFGLDLGNIST